MRANWSFILNVLLLVGVVVAIARMMKERRRNNAPAVKPPPFIGGAEKINDDIIAVRKVNREEPISQPAIESVMQVDVRPAISVAGPSLGTMKPTVDGGASAPVMIFLLAKGNRQLAGYELLQTLLAAGLRFGEGQLFHRHQNPNGQGPVLCSLAAATASGVFDLQNIGAFSVRGLCLFMQMSGHCAIDSERFGIMLDTAKQLSEELDTYLLDDQRKPLSEASLKRYYASLNISDVCEPAEVA